MSYLTQAALAVDEHIASRVTACCALEGIDNPQDWAYQHRWQLSARPGWDAAYAHAIATGEGEPGADEAAITDAMILSAVQAIVAEETEGEPA